MKKIHPYLVEPEKYRDYSRRCVKVPMWKTFENKTHCTILRVFSQKEGMLINYKEDIDFYTKELRLGNVVWPFFETLFANNFNDLVDEIKRQGLYLFDFWGHVPGSSTEKTWGHVVPPEGTVEYMEKVLGDHFLGIDNGEQDGRYIGGYAPQMCPNYTDRRKQYLNFHHHFERLCSELKNKMSVLVSLTYGHYFAKEGNTMLIGAETAQGLPNSQVYYAFLRGAGKQYGVLWFGNSSVWNRWGYKTYENEKQVLVEGSPGLARGPEHGTSLMLLKRLLYTHYLYNSVIIGFEQSWIVGDDTEKRIMHLPVLMDSEPSTKILTPIGEIQARANEFIERHGKPGGMYTPVSILLDFYSGWTVPRHLYSKKLYQVWGNLPYSPGDYLTHGIFSMLYPGYEDSSYYRNERGFLSPTPYGDMTDVILTDAEEWIFSMYSTIIVGGEIGVSEEIKTKLENFVKNGGRLIINAGNIIKFKDELAGLKVTEGAITFPVNTEITFGKIKIKEVYTFKLYKCSIKNGEILGKCHRVPAVIKVRYGKGEMVAFMAPFGVGENISDKGKNISIDGGTIEVSLPNPYPLLVHVRYILNTVLKEERIFKVGEEMGYITCRKHKGKYTIGIYNNSLTQRKFKIKSLAGKIETLKELDIDCSEKGMKGYLPGGFKEVNTGENTEDTIAGGDIRIFEVKIKERAIKELPSLKRVTPPANRYLGLGETKSIKEEILYRPTFFQHFCGVKVNWDYFRDRDLNIVKKETAWFKLQGLDIITDFSKGLNFYPTLTILDNINWRYRDNLKDILDVFDKMNVAEAKNAIFCLHRKPENHFNDEQTSVSFLKNMSKICNEADKREITIHLQNHPNKWYAKSKDMVSFISKAKVSNLRFCLNIGHVILSGENPKDILSKVGKHCSMVLISAPSSDGLNQMYDAHLPISGSKFEKAIRDSIVHIRDKAIILDAEYTDYDQEYRDLRIIESVYETKLFLGMKWS